MQKNRSLGPYIILCAALLAVSAFAVLAQSGRRTHKPEPQPTPVVAEATPTPRPTPTPGPTLKFVVGIDRYSEFSRASLYMYSGVVRNCVDRLSAPVTVKADAAAHDMTRADAIKQAKAEKDTYVVYLQLRANTGASQTTINDDPNSLYIEYHVYAPVTGKQETQGNTYPEAYRNRTIRLPTPNSNGDYYLNQAARGAAERILDHFHQRTPNTTP